MKESGSSLTGTNKPDILVFLSDQHHAMYAGFAGHKLVRTPHLDRLAGDGVVFGAAYTSCPLCVPARVSMLTGQLPEQTGVYSNGGAVPGDQATFLHSLAAEGYETVLCGRMHFLGDDQRHGFTKRIMGEMTPLYWGRYGPKRSDLGPYVGTMSSDSLRIIGGGNSPVLEYDRAVIRAALAYLGQSHDKPQCLVVGTYGPHHTYVAPPELYSYYREQVTLPESYAADHSHPVIARLRKRELGEEVTLKLRAAYLGMIEQLDGQIGQVREAWSAYLRSSARTGVFVYLSDHGEQAGEHGMIGKTSFYEGSAKIPMIFAGEGVSVGRSSASPVSIMDLGPTLCAMVGAEAPPRQGGRSLAGVLAGGAEQEQRHVVSEYIVDGAEGIVAGRMIRQGKWKLISYSGHETDDLLFDLEEDPYELNNVLTTEPQQAAELRRLLTAEWDTAAILDKHRRKMEHQRLLARWGAAVDVPEPERWPIPEEAKRLPVVE